MKKQLIATGICLSFLNQIAFAAPFRIVGTRALGIGGANVAVAEGPDAQYWNPGALGVTTGSGFQIPFNASYQATGNLLQKADAISKAADALQDARDAQTNGSALSLQQVRDTNDALLKILDLNNGGTAALVDATAGLQNRFGSVAVSFNQYADVGLQPIVDPNFNLGSFSGGSGLTLNGTGSLDGSLSTADRDVLSQNITDLSTKLGITLNASADDVANKLMNDALAGGLTPTQISDAVAETNGLVSELLPQINGTGGSELANNDTRVLMTGAAVSEIALGYGHPVMDSSKWGLLSLGGNVKALRGEVGYARLRLIDGEDTSLGDALSDARKTTKTSVKPAFDLGLLYRLPFKHRLQFGVLGRNLNSPSFDTPDTRIADGLGKYKEEAQTRAGVAFWPMKRWMVSGDLDLNENDTTIPGVKTQTWGLGTEFKLWILDLRAGLNKDFGAKMPVVYTGGFGLNIGAFKIDAAGAISSDNVKLEENGEEVPAAAQFSFNIGLVFGRGQERVVKHQSLESDAFQNPADAAPVAAEPVTQPAAVETPAAAPASEPVVAPAAATQSEVAPAAATTPEVKPAATPKPAAKKTHSKKKTKKKK